MKKIFFIFALAVLAMPLQAAAEQIISFDARLVVNQDSSLKVTENIVYDFGGDLRHGIYRDIPVKYERSGGNYNIRLSEISAVDEKGVAYPFDISNRGRNKRIKIGDPNSTIAGVHTYVISYTVKRAINFFEDHDELYWNATGNEWPAPIANSSAEVFLPQAVSEGKLQAACFAGGLGSTASCQNIHLAKNSADLAASISFSQNSLSAGRGLTIVVGWPKGIVKPPSTWQNWSDVVKDNWILAIPLIVLLAFYQVWRTRGRDPDIGTIVPEYAVPENLTPAEMGALVDEKADNADISAEIIHLAVKGYLKIIRTEKKVLGIFDSVDYELELIKPKDQALTALEVRLLEGVFGSKLLESLPSVKLSSLKNKFYEDLSRLKEMAYEAVVTRGYFVRSPDKVRRNYRLLGGLFLGLGFFPMFFFRSFNFYWMLAWVISGVIVFIFSFHMPSKTSNGAKAKARVLGLKLYLSVAEKDRLKFHNAPEKRPEIFEQLLPYAMVLKVEESWAKQFEGIYNQPPKWYVGSYGSFNAVLFTYALGDFSRTTNAALVSRPGSAGSGASGFGGGGFSGGGFGGGGGGSW